MDLQELLFLETGSLLILETGRGYVLLFLQEDGMTCHLETRVRTYISPFLKSRLKGLRKTRTWHQLSQMRFCIVRLYFWLYGLITAGKNDVDLISPVNHLMKKHCRTDAYADFVALLATTAGQSNLFDKTQAVCSGWSPSVQWPKTVFWNTNTESYKQEQMRKVCLHLLPLFPELKGQIIYMHKWRLHTGICL